MQVEAIDRWLEEHDGEMVRFAQELLRIPSVKEGARPGQPFGPGPARALERALAEGERLGFESRNVEGYAGHVEAGEGAELVGVLCHLDVVPAGSGWSHPPFGGVVADGFLVGRGAVDDKGPSAAALYALAAVARARPRWRRRLRLIFGTDEESGWADMDFYLAREERPQLGFSPDANFPIVHAEKGILTFDAVTAFPAGAAGGGSGSVLQLEGGSRPNVVPDAADALVDRGWSPSRSTSSRAEGSGVEVEEEPRGWRLRARGRAAHGSTPEEGVNAAALLLAALLAGSGLDPRQRAALEALQAMLPSDGSGLDVALRDEVSGPLTANLGVVRLEEGFLRATFDLRYPVSYRKEALLERIERRLASAGWRLERVHDQPPHHVPAEAPEIRLLARAYEEVTGRPATLLAIGGGTYARLIPGGVAFGPVMPGQPELAHNADERIALDDLRRAARIWARAMAYLACEPEG
ncbi:MAG: dipeptidase PepV [Bacillota bacterium]|nr:dipeptidase PepV [Bacillota bacterium]